MRLLKKKPQHLIALATVVFLTAIYNVYQPTLDEDLHGRVVSITDGDTLKILTGTQQVKIRLAEIDTPEREQPWGTRAKQALSDKVFGKDVRVKVVDTDRHGRTVGKIWLDSRDINREMVREGHAWVYRKCMKDKSLLDDEDHARKEKLGLWSLPDVVPPWEWRRTQ